MPPQFSYLNLSRNQMCSQREYIACLHVGKVFKFLSLVLKGHVSNVQDSRQHIIIAIHSQQVSSNVSIIVPIFNLFKCHLAILTILISISYSWIKPFLQLHLGTLPLLFSPLILSQFCLQCHCNLVIGARIPLLPG